VAVEIEELLPELKLLKYYKHESELKVESMQNLIYIMFIYEARYFKDMEIFH
jgi:hypothetical protein